MEYKMITATSMDELQKKVIHLHKHNFVQFGDTKVESVGGVSVYRLMLARDM